MQHGNIADLQGKKAENANRAPAIDKSIANFMQRTVETEHVFFAGFAIKLRKAPLSYFVDISTDELYCNGCMFLRDTMQV